MNSDFYDYDGVIHVHSTYSDGMFDIPDIIYVANKENCDFLILTDHDTLKGICQEGTYDNTVFLVGEEITLDADKGHYLAMRINSEINPGGSTQETIDNVKNDNGLGFIAHPLTRSDDYKFMIDPVEWKDWTVSGFNGIEIWDYSHDWIENFTFYNFLSGLIWPDLFIEGPFSETLAKWDELLTVQKVIGIGALDAHGYFYPYRRMFRTIRTHILLEKPLSFNPSSFRDDKNNIYKALETGNCYVSYDYLGNAEGFMFSAEQDHEKAIMGDTLNLSSDIIMHVLSPQPAYIKVIKDGQIFVSQENIGELKVSINEPGIYRTEVYKFAFRGLRMQYRPWILSNPIYIL